MREIITDPVEAVVADALRDAGIQFTYGGQNSPPLDFYLPETNVWIECKQFHTDRITRQMASVKEIIVIQGMKAARQFAALVQRTKI